jgi:hypothetical protein
MRWVLVFLVGTLLVVGGVSAVAVGPGDGTGTIPTSSPPARSLSSTGFSGSSETSIDGKVMNLDGDPLGDVTVKLYVGGLLLAEMMTSPDGTYEIVELIDYGRDVTITLWFVPTDPTLVMENVILKESTAALQRSLYSPCIKRIRIDPLTYAPIRLMSLDSRIRRLGESDCAG